MVTIDEYSRFPIIKIIKVNDADTVIRHWTETFQISGNPDDLKTDNGPPFQSHKISKFLADRIIRHRKITPLWPRANAIWERFMRNLNRVMRNSYIAAKNWRVELDIFLSNYRATPHDSKMKSKNHHFINGDRVCLKIIGKNKSTQRYDPVPFTITKINHSMITATRGKESKTRNCSFFIHQI
jgi:hypothetical protein